MSDKGKRFRLENLKTNISAHFRLFDKSKHLIEDIPKSLGHKIERIF